MQAEWQQHQNSFPYNLTSLGVFFYVFLDLSKPIYFHTLLGMSKVQAVMILSDFIKQSFSYLCNWYFSTRIIFCFPFNCIVFWIVLFLYISFSLLHTNFSTPVLSFQFYYLQLSLTEVVLQLLLIQTFFENTLILKHLSIKPVIIQHWNCIARCNAEIYIFITSYVTTQILFRSSQYKLFHEFPKFVRMQLETSFSSPPSRSILEKEGPEDNFTS